MQPRDLLFVHTYILNNISVSARPPVRQVTPPKPPSPKRHDVRPTPPRPRPGTSREAGPQGPPRPGPSSGSRQETTPPRTEAKASPTTLRLREIENEMSTIDTKIEELSLRRQELVSQRQKPRPGTSTEVYAPTVRIPEEMCEYDKLRQKNIEERQRKLKELGLNDLDWPGPGKSGQGRKESAHPAPSTEPTNPRTRQTAQPETSMMRKGPCPAGNKCTCGDGWECHSCRRCPNGCLLPCPEAVEQTQPTEESPTQDSSWSQYSGPPEESRDLWESLPRIRGSSVPQTPKNPETNSSSIDPNFDQYAFVFPCPGEGMGGIGEHCSLRNLCLECGLCKVCGHCSRSCPDYINMPSKPLMTPLVSIYFVG